MLNRLSLDEVEVVDLDLYRHVAEVEWLLTFARERGLTFATVDPDGPAEDEARVLNLAFWRPGDVAEILDEPYLTADQLAHNTWHAAAERALGPAARTAPGLLLAEAVASAFDVYLVGRLIGHHPDAPMLESQVPAMRDSATAAGLDEDEIEAMLTRFVDAPEASFGALWSLLYDVGLALAEAKDAEAAAEVLHRHRDAPLGALLHHYELPTWVLFARAYADAGDASSVASVVTALREAGDPVRWLCESWLGKPA